MSVKIQSVAAELRSKRIQPVGYLDLLFSSPAIANNAAAGQFVMLRLDSSSDPLLPRPFDLVEVNPELGTFRLIIKIVGKATNILKELEPGDSVKVTGPLGAPISDFRFSSLALLIRGCGAAAALFFLKEAKKRNIRIHTVLSAATARKLVLQAELSALSDNFFIATDDGSEGQKALGTDVLRTVVEKHRPQRVYAVGGGPFYLPYLEELNSTGKIPVYLFLESYMACGFGHCHGCAVETRSGGYRLVCQDGPLFNLSEVKNPCLIYQ